MSIAHNKPEHIAIIMDGNGRWAGSRGLPRAAGHRAGVKALRNIVEFCAGEGIRGLTVYAFSSENWRRPKNEVGFLMELFINALEEQVEELHQHRINIRFIGELGRFPEKLRQSITAAETLTEDNDGLQLRVAANYGGRWDICNAFKLLYEKILAGDISPDEVDEQLIGRFLALSDLPEPDLFIRTGGEKRISNYLLWQLAYTEMYFSDVFWPDFSVENLVEACEWFEMRQRRFGGTSEHPVENSDA